MLFFRFALLCLLISASALAVTTTGNTTNGSSTVTNINTTGIVPGMPVTGAGIQAGTLVASIPTPGNPGILVLSLAATATAANVSLTFQWTGNITVGSNVITNISTTGLAIGMSVTGTGIPAGATIVSITPGNPGSILISGTATATANNVPLTFAAAAASGVPTLGTWGMLLFMCMLLLYGLKVMRPALGSR